jgi:methylmalonyl-CoA/ethylmalonyl-CoA epimerase
MIIDHICFAVKDLEKGIGDWTHTFGYEQMTEIVTNTRQQVRVVFLSREGSLTIKLIEPCEGNRNLERFVEKGGGFHHLCFRCDDLESGIQDLKERGVLKLVDPQPGEAFENENIAFMLTRFGINVELIDTDKKAKKL